MTENGDSKYTLTISGTGAMKDNEDMFADDIPGEPIETVLTPLLLEMK